MKHLLLLATTMLTITATPAAFGMQGEGEEEPSKIKVTANLNAELSPKVSHEWLKAGQFLKAPKNFQYNFIEHSIFFDMDLNEAKRLSKFKFSTKYIPQDAHEQLEVNRFKGVNYEHIFGCNLSDNAENNKELQAILLSITKTEFRSEEAKASLYARIPILQKIYEIEDINSWAGVPAIVEGTYVRFGIAGSK